jgi:HEAT repeat protein
MLNSKDPGAGSQAVWALAGQGTEEARRLIERAIDSKDPSTRMAAISSLMQNPDDRSTDTLLRLARDSDASVRATALSTLGQIGSERAQAAILDATRYGKTEDRVAAISGLANMDDPRASQQLASLMKDRDPAVATQAIQMSYNGGAEVDTSLTQIVTDPSSTDAMKALAAQQLRNRGTDLDDSTEAVVTKLAGAANLYGGYGYGGGYMGRGEYME